MHLWPTLQFVIHISSSHLISPENNPSPIQSINMSNINQPINLFVFFMYCFIFKYLNLKLQTYLYEGKPYPNTDEISKTDALIAIFSSRIRHDSLTTGKKSLSINSSSFNTRGCTERTINHEMILLA